MADQHLLHAEHEDAMLVKAVIQGETSAFKQLITKYERLVNSIVYKMVGQVHDREDLCQEIFLRVYKYLPSFKFQSKLSTWIGNIAFNICVNFLKKKKLVFIEEFQHQAISSEEPETADFDVQIMDRSPLPDEMLVNKENIHLLLEAVADLNPIEKTILHLFHQEGQSLEEIGAITAIPVNTVKSHLFRARKNLKNKMIKLINA